MQSRSLTRNATCLYRNWNPVPDGHDEAEVHTGHLVRIVALNDEGAYVTCRDDGDSFHAFPDELTEYVRSEGGWNAAGPALVVAACAAALVLGLAVVIVLAGLWRLLAGILAP